MTKKEIVKQISEECGLTQLKTKEVVQKTFEAIIKTLLERPHRIELRNFGVFEVKLRASRKARNPRTGERVDVAAKCVVTFKPGKEMEEQVLRLQMDPALATSLSTDDDMDLDDTPETGTSPVTESRPATGPSPAAPAAESSI